VKELPRGAVRWLVVGVVVYTGVGLLRAAFKEKPASQVGAVQEPAGA